MPHVGRSRPIDRITAFFARFPAASLAAVIALVPARPDPASARQLGEEDRVRLAAFEHLVTVLFPADTTRSHTYCVDMRDESDFNAPPEGPGRDPGAGLLSRFRRTIPRVVPASECPDPTAAAQDAAGGSPVIYSVGRLTQIGSAMRVPVSYRVHGMNGGGWSCTLRPSDGSWIVVDCLPTWIS